MHIYAPAKLNLSLDILGKREDGYHLMKMLMQSIDLCDQLDLLVTDQESSFTCSNQELSDGKSNLAMKAAELFLKNTGISCGISIHLQKKIPSGAGMGGGSADAAAVLAGLNLLLKTGLPLKTLKEWALPLGADVPFCLQGGLALVEGIGERITPLPPLEPCCFVVCKPPFFISTKEAFSAFDHNKEVKHPNFDEIYLCEEGKELLFQPEKMQNVFESVLMPKEKAEIETIKQKLLSDGAISALMTGSGSAVFGLFEQETAAKISYENRIAEGMESYLCHPIGTGPFTTDREGKEVRL